MQELASETVHHADLVPRSHAFVAVCDEFVQDVVDLGNVTGTSQLGSRAANASLEAAATCRALLVTHSHLQHDAAAIRLNLGAMAGGGALVSPPTSSSYDQAMLEKLTPWIVTSPPRPSQSPFQAPFQRQPAQPFVDFSYKRPSKKAQEPTLLQLTIAPIDVIYSQLCLLSLLDFLNAAWPAAGLDPLKVWTGVSLREIVQEKLLGGQQRHQMARRQQHSMQRTKVL
ncbi:hypothetical protein ABBQ32_005484 [Trebouxia sp. C0010 RCD-2024]